MHHAWNGISEYGDCTDVMGCGPLGTINLPHRLFMNWQDLNNMAALNDPSTCSGNKKATFYLHQYDTEIPIVSPDGGLSNVGMLLYHWGGLCFFFLLEYHEIGRIPRARAHAYSYTPTPTPTPYTRTHIYYLKILIRAVVVVVIFILSFIPKRSSDRRLRTSRYWD